MKNLQLRGLHGRAWKVDKGRGGWERGRCYGVTSWWFWSDSAFESMDALKQVTSSHRVRFTLICRLRKVN